MEGKTAVDTLNYLIDLLVCYLEDIEKENNSDLKEFILGERLAFIECLEVVQMWEYAHNNGLDFDIEAKYPI